MKKHILSILTLLLISCQTNKEMQNIEIAPLSPYHYEFIDNENKLNNIDYLFLKGEYEINEKFNDKLEKFISNYNQNRTDKYTYNSVYIYKETTLLNKDYKGDKSTFDGLNNDLVSYVRFHNNKLDIFYIIDKGNVVFDLIENREVDFEFEQKFFYYQISIITNKYPCSKNQ